LRYETKRIFQHIENRRVERILIRQIACIFLDDGSLNHDWKRNG